MDEFTNINYVASISSKLQLIVVRDTVTQPRVGQLMWKVSKIQVLLCPWVAWLDTVSQSNHSVSGHMYFVGDSCWRPMMEND